MYEELRTLEQKLDRIEQLTLIGAKNVLNLDEAVLITGLSKGHLYRLTSEHRIPHFKKCRHLYFEKAELERWLMEHRVNTREDIESIASTYVATH